MIPKANISATVGMCVCNSHHNVATRIWHVSQANSNTYQRIENMANPKALKN